MEEMVARTRHAVGSLMRGITPWIRQILRFLALPYCMVATVDRRECPRSGLAIAADMLHIFFQLGYYPDNYGKCRLWEVPRGDWRLYFGSGYNPFQRARLSREVQRPGYGTMFADKQVAQIVTDAMGIPGPRCHGYIAAGQAVQDFVAGMDRSAVAADELIVKPVLGAAGRSIYKIELEDGTTRILDGQGRLITEPVKVLETSIVQEVVRNHSDLARINDRSLNTLRMLTFLTRDGRSRLLSAFVRFGVGDSVIDNWSAGGVAVGVDLATGGLQSRGLNKRGQAVPVHPTSGVEFGEVAVPCWQDAVAFAERVQAEFPFYRMLGLDVAVTPDGPMLIEINESPDLVLQEQTSGPLLKDPMVLVEFDRHGLLTHSMARHLADDVARARNLLTDDAAG